MKRFLLIPAVLAVTALAVTAQPKLRKDNVEEVLRAMTLEEKVDLLVGRAKTAIVDGVPSGTIEKVAGASGNTCAIPRLGIPETILSDGPAGVHINPTREGDNRTFYGTGFPIGTLLACSWDPALVSEATAAIGQEAKDYGIDVMLAPGANIHRNPLCGRNFEYFSEDPVLSGKIAAAYIKGVQSQGVGATLKHFAANNQESNRFHGESRVGKRALREIYLKNFEIAVREAQPWCIMSSYNKLNGPYTQQSHDLLTTVLRDEWGFSGIVMTDWGCKDGTVEAVKAGNDLMEPGEQVERDRILEAVKDGRITGEELDRNVRNMLNYIVKTPSFAQYKYSETPDLKAHAEAARKAAEGSIVLLRNESKTLPLSTDAKVALFGAASVDFVAGGTGSGNVNKPYVVEMDEALEGGGFSIDQDLKNYYAEYKKYTKATYPLSFAGNPVGLAIFINFHGGKLPEPELPEATFAEKAKTNDVALVVFSRVAGEVIDRKIEDDFLLTGTEMNLLKNVSRAFHAQGKKVVVVLNVSGVVETASWKQLADAIVLPFAPGQEGSRAVADVLSGKVNPSGKLPMTFPLDYFDVPSALTFPYEFNKDKKLDPLTVLVGFESTEKNIGYTDYEEGIYMGYRYYEATGKRVSYPFGFGLSYTTFEYSKPLVKASKDGFTASVTVTNRGSVSGRESVQLYVSAPNGGLDKPVKELKAFAKTRELQPGESETLSMSVSAYELASFNEALSQWETAAGEYILHFAATSNDVRAKASFKMSKNSTYPVNNVFQLAE